MYKAGSHRRDQQAGKARYVLNKQSTPSKLFMNRMAVQVSKDENTKSWWRDGPAMSKQINTSARESRQMNIPRRPRPRTQNQVPIRQGRGKGSRPQRQRPRSSQMISPETRFRQDKVPVNRSTLPKSSSVEKRKAEDFTKRLTTPEHHSLRSGLTKANEVKSPESVSLRRKLPDGVQGYPSELKQSSRLSQERAPKIQSEESKGQLQFLDEQNDKRSHQRSPSSPPEHSPESFKKQYPKSVDQPMQRPRTSSLQGHEIKLSKIELEISDHSKHPSSASSEQERERYSTGESRQPMSRSSSSPSGRPATQRPSPRQGGRFPRRFGLSEDFKASPSALAQRATMTKAVRAQLQEEMKFRNLSKTELDDFFTQAKDYQMRNMKLQEKFMHGVELSFVNGLLSL